MSAAHEPTPSEQAPLEGRPLPGEPLPSELGDAGQASMDVSETMRLLHLAKAGDDRSRDAVFARYRPRLLRLIRMRMGHDLLRIAEPEDVLQDTMITWLMKFEHFTPEHRGSLLAWLDRIARRKIKDLREKLRVRGNPESVDTANNDAESDAAAGIDLPAKSAGPRTENMARELKERFDDLVAGLSERERNLVVLRVYLELEWADIVKELGYPTEHAGQQALCRIRDKLRAGLPAESR
ncbi:MAG: sigma-70 family RNA polymerase sigma factor [Planctomycetes bacterium]|nr:sigma-70 family RNA polymerase sigma factor [Planctomycetota bacterium]